MAARIQLDKLHENSNGKQDNFYYDILRLSRGIYVRKIVIVTVFPPIGGNQRFDGRYQVRQSRVQDRLRIGRGRSEQGRVIQDRHLEFQSGDKLHQVVRRSLLEYRRQPAQQNAGRHIDTRKRLNVKRVDG